MTVPRFNRGFRLRHDAVRNTWVILAPERLFALDDHAAEVLKLVDGKRSLDDITALLSRQYQASSAEIASDVKSMFDDLVAKGAIQL